ncbi:MAG: GGDEF domain-containing protein [Oscillospiraceae bacterium]
MLDYKLFVYNTCSDLYWNTLNERGEKSVFDLIDYDITDAVVIFRETFYDKALVGDILVKASAAGKPAIVIDGEVNGSIAGCVNITLSYRQGFESLVRHIVEYHGCRDTVMMAGLKGEPYSEERIRIFRKVMAENDFSVGDEAIYYGDYWSIPTERATEELLFGGRLPQAILCANDAMAIVVCSVLKKHGYTVPDDVLVTGFDGTYEAKLSAPPLTTCGCSYDKLAKQIRDILTKKFDGEDICGNHVLSYEPRFVQSCGCSEETPIYAGGRLKQLNDRFNRYVEEERTLHEMSAEILKCENGEQVSARLGKFNFYNMCCILNRDCLDETVNPMLEPEGFPFSETMCVLYKSDAEQSFYSEFPRKKILPDLDYVFEENNPLVFSAVNFLNIPLGYTCFHFNVYVENYLKIPQFVYALSNAVGGYRNIRHQTYMAAHIEQIYKYDSLTGLFNRNGFYKELKTILDALPEDRGARLVIVSADLDGLKYINDTFGHDEGDRAIRSVADALSSVRLKNKICARIGGDELLAVAVVRSGEVDAEQIRFDLLTALECYNDTAENPYKVSSSIGVIISDSNRVEFESLLKEADNRLYSDKTGKPNCRRG